MPGEQIRLGELWLRAKIKHHTKKTFHRADSQLVYVAVKSVLAELDRERELADRYRDLSA